MSETEEDRRLRAKGRFAGLLIAGTMLGWLGIQWLGPRIGMNARFAVLFDLMALAAFTFALIVTYQIWRARQDEEG